VRKPKHLAYEAATNTFRPLHATLLLVHRASFLPPFFFTNKTNNMPSFTTSTVVFTFAIILLLANPAHAFGAGNIASVAKIEGLNCRHFIGFLHQ
jgi:hypothetical protein